MIIGFLCYLPYLLKYFPGLMNSDSYNQVLQLQGLNPYFKQFISIEKIIKSLNKVIENNGLTKEDIKWVVPHQANLRIIESVAHMLQIPKEKVLVNIERYGNTSAVSVPLCLKDYEHILKKGDKVILTTFGAGYSWGAIYLIWGYDGQSRINLAKNTEIKK